MPQTPPRPAAHSTEAAADRIDAPTPGVLTVLLLRWGLAAMVLLITLGSVAVSILIAAGLTYGVFGGSMGLSAWVITIATPALIAPVMTWLTLRLVLQLERARADLDHAVHHDPLTGLHNRRYFMQALQQQIRDAAQTGVPFAVAIIDVDNFKAINDRHGHLGGDAVLRQLVQQCCAHLRASDVFARIGGEEFALLLRDTDRAQALQCAERFRLAAQAQPVAMPQGPQPVTISIGLALFQQGMHHVDRLLRLADQALYVAKRNGKNRIEIGVAAGAEVA